MELTIKHLAPYLPYGLQIEIFNYKQDYTGIQYAKANGYYFISNILHLTYEGGNTGKSTDIFKPILKPISDLPPSLDYYSIWSHNNYLHYPNAIDNLPYGVFVQMVSEHFDVFGLIPAGLAIDINTLTATQA
jgi:hypothetical protein